MVFGEIISAINLWEKFQKWRNPVETVTARFVRLFESHGVHRNQIPRFFGHGLTLKDVQDDASLLIKLNEEMLEAACSRFAVRREWLDGAEQQIYPEHEFYKRPEDFVKFLDELRASNPDGRITGVLITPDERDWNTEALLVLQETIGFVGDKEIYRYHLCDNWIFSYWKARGYLTACIAIAWKRQVYVHGTYSTKKIIDNLIQGQTLLDWQGDGIWAVNGKRWYPEDMALRPDLYLLGVDAEQSNFGIKSALELWLLLEEDGFMEVGIKREARQLFLDELACQTA